MYIAAVDFAEGFDAQKIAAENKAIFAEHAAAEQKTLAEFIAGYAYKGEQTFHPSRLSPNTDYVVYVYGIDSEGEATTDVIVEPFKSLPVEPGPMVDCKIDIVAENLTSTSVKVVFNPSDPTVQYFYTMLDQAGYEDISKDWPGYIYEYMVSQLTDDGLRSSTIVMLSSFGSADATEGGDEDERTAVANRKTGTVTYLVRRRRSGSVGTVPYVPYRTYVRT